MCWTRARPSSGLVHAARQHADARVRTMPRARGTAVPISLRTTLGRGAPTVAMKWRDTVKAAIMHGPLPPDVTLDVPQWWQPGMPLLCPTDFLGASATEAQTRRVEDRSCKANIHARARRGEAVVRGLPRLSRPCPWQGIQRNLLRLRVIYLCDRFGISQDRVWNLDETAVRMVPAGECGWTKRAKSAPCLRLARLRHGHTCCKHERRHVDTECPQGEDRPSAHSWTTLSAPARVPLADALDHARGSLGHGRRN